MSPYWRYHDPLAAIVLQVIVFSRKNEPSSPGRWMTRTLRILNGSVRWYYCGNGWLRGSYQLFADEVHDFVGTTITLWFHTFRQSPPLLVSRRPENAPGGVDRNLRTAVRRRRRGDGEPGRGSQRLIEAYGDNTATSITYYLSSPVFR